MPSGEQRVEVRVEGRRNWHAVSVVSPATFEVTRLEDGALGSVKGNATLDSDDGEILRVTVEVGPLLGQSSGSIRVENLTTGRSVDGVVAQGSPNISPAPDGTWNLTLRADWGSFYRGEWYPGTITFNLGAEDSGGSGSSGSASVSTGPCFPELLVTLDANQPLLADGQSTDFDAVVRNEPSGPCLGTASGPSVGGVVELVGGSDGTTVEDVAVWMRSATGAVYPSTSGLAVGGEGIPGACPGGTAEGCASTVQDVVGNVAYPAGTDISVAEGETVDLPFRYFPTLAPGDEAALIGGATVTVAISTDDGVHLASTAVNFTAAPAVTDVAVTIASEVTEDVGAQAGDIAPGAQMALESIGWYTADGSHPDSVVFTATAAGTANGSPAVATDETLVQLGPDASLRPSLPVTALPDVLESGAESEILVSARPHGAPDSPVLATVTVDGAASGDIALNDQGVDGDLAAEDGVYGATAIVTAAGDATVDVATTIDGAPVAGSMTLQVVPAGTPLVPTTMAIGPTISGPNGGTFIADRVIVHFAEDATVDNVLAAAAAVGGELVGRITDGTWQISVPPLTDHAAFEAVAAQLSALDHVIGVELEAVVEQDAVVPNDPGLGQQWHHAKMRQDQAWLTNRGNGRSVVVGVIDTGADLDHPDLAGKLVSGQDFFHNDSTPQDVNGHGTHVAGIIGAASNNAAGVAGVSWGARIMPVNVFSDAPRPARPKTSDGAIAAGIRWAVNSGARVINLSLGGGPRNEAIVAALQHAWINDVVVVASAGNDGVQTKNYPAAYSRSETFSSWWGLSTRHYTTDVIAVGSTDGNDARSLWPGPNCPACGSNFGSWVDIAAPGTAIYSTIVDNTYDALSGTSMASPNVAGVAALIRSQEPYLTTELVRRRLVGTAFDIGNQQIGRRVDTYEALFNGSFELEALETWERSGDARTVKRLGSIGPLEGKRMALIGTGPAGTSVAATLVKRLSVDPAAVKDGVVTVSFRYNYLTEEYPEFVGSQYNDFLRAVVRTPAGTEIEMATETVNTTAWTPESGIDFPGGDSTVGKSGWKTATVTIAAADLNGPGALELVISDVGDAIYDSVALIDDVELR